MSTNMAACRRAFCSQIVKSRGFSFFLLLCFVFANFYLFYSNWALPKQGGKRFHDKGKTKQYVKNYKPVAAKDNITDVESEKNSHIWENVDVVIPFSNAVDNTDLQKRLKVCVESILKYSSVFITFHIIGDVDSWGLSEKIFQEIMEQRKVEEGSKLGGLQHRTVYEDISKVSDHVGPIVRVMQRKFSSKQGTYYSHIVFYLSVALHKIFSEDLEKVIMLDSDLKFQADIRELFSLFNNFSVSNIIGIAPEMQPVYRHTFQMYRDKHPGTPIGEPLPKGKPGFNSGVLLLDLKRMRQSKKYNAFLTAHFVENLAKKYLFQGHLGDQDFFSLLSMDYEELFFMLPCVWNFQLCTWWKDKGYNSVFKLYHNCNGSAKILHGNCGTPIQEKY